MAEAALLSDYGVPINDETRRMLAVLGGLGSHDLSAMREVIVVYESGINSVLVFAAHIEIYTANKIVRINYDTPYIKGLPTTMTVRERATGPRGEPCYQERHVRTTYEDSYTIEFKEWHDCTVNNKGPKTTIADARQDLDIF